MPLRSDYRGWRTDVFPSTMDSPMPEWPQRLVTIIRLLVMMSCEGLRKCEEAVRFIAKEQLRARMERQKFGAQNRGEHESWYDHPDRPRARTGRFRTAIRSPVEEQSTERCAGCCILCGDRCSKTWTHRVQSCLCPAHCLYTGELTLMDELD